jgi:hypothetical protein
MGSPGYAFRGRGMTADVQAPNGHGPEPATSIRRSTLIITNMIKVAGLALAVREMLTRRDPVVIAACVTMMSGVQGLEQVVVSFFERFFGRGAG